MSSPSYQRPTKEIGSERLSAQARDHFRVAEAPCRKFFAGRKLLDPAVFEAFLTRHPMRNATREQVALHEAGHFIGFERVGSGAFQAHVDGTPFGHYGWGGGANGLDRLEYLYPEEWTPDQLRREAWTGLGSPIAEELIGGGDALGSVGELVEAAVLAFKAADVARRDGDKVLREVIVGGVSLVECCRAEIEAVAAVLGRRKRITCSERSVKKILARVPRTPFVAAPLSAEGRALGDKIMGAFAQLEFLGLPLFGEAV